MADQEISVSLNPHVVNNVPIDTSGFSTIGGGIPYPATPSRLGGFYGDIPTGDFSQQLAGIPIGMKATAATYGPPELFGPVPVFGPPEYRDTFGPRESFGPYPTFGPPVAQDVFGPAEMFGPPAPTAPQYEPPGPGRYFGSRYEGPSGIPYSAPDMSAGMNATEWAAATSSPSPMSSASSGSLSMAEDVGPYRSKLNARTDAISELQDTWTRAGRFPEIGKSPAWAEAEQSHLESLGLASPVSEAASPSFGSRYGHAFNSSGGLLSLGFAAIETSERMSQNAARNDSGQYVTPEMQAASSVSSVSQGLGSILGLGVGALSGNPQIAMLAAMGGGAAGSVFSADYTAGQERAQAGRETGELIANQMGEAASRVKEFSEALANANAPIKELQTALGTLAGLAPGINNTSTVSGAAGLSNALGERYNPALSGGAKFIGSDANLMGLAPQFAAGGGNLGPAELGNLSVNAAFQGDWQASNDFATLQEGAIRNPAYSRDRAFLDRENNKSGFDKWKTSMTTPSRVDWFSNHENDAYGAAEQRLKNEPEYLPGASPEDIARTNAARTEAFGVHTAAARAQVYAGTAFSLAGNSLGILGASGASEDQLDAAAGGVYSTASGAASTYDSSAASIAAYVAKHPEMSDSDRLSYEQQEAKLGVDAGTARQTSAQTQQSRYMARFGAGQASFSTRILQRTLNGASADDLSGDFAQQDAFLGNAALSGPFSDAQRDQIQGTRATNVYQQAQSRYGQEEGAIAVSGAYANSGVATAQATGSAGDVYGARGAQIDNLIQKEQEYESQIARGNLTIEQRQQKYAQIAELAGEITQAESSRRNEYFSGQSELLAANYGADVANADRDIRRGGNAAFNPRLITDTNEQITNAQATLAAAKTPLEIAKAKQSIALLGNQQDANYDAANTWQMGAAEQVSDIQTRGAFSRSLLNPWMDGPDSAPFTRGAAVLATDRRELAELDANKQRVISSGGRWAGEDETAYARRREGLLNDQAQMEHAQRTAMFDAVPQMLLGAPSDAGVSSAVLPLAAASAMFSPSPIAGNFGRSTPTASPHMAQEGGAAGAFSTATKSQDNERRMVTLLEELVRLVRPGPSGPPNNMAAANNRTLSQAITR